jgi:hypothetical protein
MALSAASLVVLATARNYSNFASSWANLTLRDSRYIVALVVAASAVAVRSSVTFTVAPSLALDDASFATALAAAKRATTSCISNWVFST